MVNLKSESLHLPKICGGEYISQTISSLCIVVNTTLLYYHHLTNRKHILTVLSQDSLFWVSVLTVALLSHLGRQYNCIRSTPSPGVYLIRQRTLYYIYWLYYNYYYWKYSIFIVPSQWRRWQGSRAGFQSPPQMILDRAKNGFWELSHLYSK